MKDIANPPEKGKRREFTRLERRAYAQARAIERIAQAGLVVERELRVGDRARRKLRPAEEAADQLAIADWLQRFKPAPLPTKGRDHFSAAELAFARKHASKWRRKAEARAHHRSQSSNTRAHPSSGTPRGDR